MKLLKTSNDKAVWRGGFLLILLLTLVAPNFPTIMGTEVYINFAYGLLGVVVLLIRTVPLQKSEATIVCFYFALQLLLLGSWFMDIVSGETSFGAIGSALRPVLLALTPLTFFYFYQKQDLHPSVFLSLFLKISLIITFVYFIADYLNLVDSLKAFLWVSEKLMNYEYFISFFAVTYLAAYFYFICYLYFLVRLLFVFNLSNLFFTCLSVLLLVFVQSKTFYFLIIASIPFVWAVKGKSIAKVVSLAVFGTFLLAFGLYFEDIVILLSDGGLLGLRSLGRFVDDPAGSGSFTVRIEQILMAVNMSLNNFGFGVGLGRGEVMLESYLASFIYRYGVIGFVIYSLFFIFMSVYSYILYRRSDFLEDKILYVFCSCWYFVLPVSMFSNPMYEMGKNAIFSSLILASFLCQMRSSSARYYKYSEI